MTPEDPSLRRRAQGLLDRHEENTSEADIRGAVRDFLIGAELARAGDIQMEGKAGSGRLDLESDDLVIEVKRRIGTRLDALDGYKQQLEQYLETLAAEGRPPRLGILTDGKYWLLRRPGGGEWSTASPYAFTLDDAQRGYHLYEWLRDESQALERRGVVPSDAEVRERLGPGPRFEQHLQSLRELYEQHRDNPTIAIKRRLWRRLLAAALGEVIEEEANLDELFLRHTYLSAVVALALQSAFGIDVVLHAQRSPAELLGGQLFVDETGVRGVVESDFFTWPAEVEGGGWLRGLARRVARFEWTKAESDVARILYETVIPADDRRRLGEYYTPDWLAREIVDAVVTDPLKQRVLDPACGSGSFIFAAVRKYLSAARAAGHQPSQVLDGLLTHVIGIDVHPAAVHLARATWTFAAREALERARDGDGEDVTVPIYLGDSLQLRTETSGLFASRTVTIEIENDAGGLERNVSLEFPRSLVEQGDWFDSLMTRFAEELDQGGDPRQALDDVGIPDDADRPMLERTADTLGRLHAEGRDHIWAYYARNLVRPVALRAEPVDVIVSNPPWLTYNRSEAVVRSELERQSKSVYQIWTGGRYATHQDVAGLFFARCVDLYLKAGGDAAMVLPHSALQTGQYRNWRDGEWRSVNVDFTLRRPWDLERIEPNTFFPVPACVAFLRRTESDAKPFAQTADRWRGEQGGPFSREQVPLADTSGKFASPYGDLARQGASILPRCLFLVNVDESRATIRARNVVRTNPRRGSQDKRPWKDLQLGKLADLPIEEEHVRDVYLGETLAPYVLLDPRAAVLPLSIRTGDLVTKSDGLLGLDPGHLGTRMRRRWRTANRLWDKHKGANSQLDLLGRLDYMGELTAQNQYVGSGTSARRVVYGRGGRPTAAIVVDPRVVIDKTLYWIGTASMAEASYLTGVLNSAVLEVKVAPLMPKGQFGARDLEKHVWRLPIPEYDESEALHREIAAAARAAATGAERVLGDVRAQRAEQGKPTTVTVARREIRKWLEVSAEGARVEELVGQLLGGASVSVTEGG